MDANVLFSPHINRAGKCSSLIYDVKFENSTMLIGEWEGADLHLNTCFEDFLSIWFLLFVFFQRNLSTLKKSTCRPTAETVWSLMKKWTLANTPSPVSCFSVGLGCLCSQTVCSLDRSQTVIPSSDFFDCRQAKERLFCCCGGSQKKSRVPQYVFAYNRRPKLRSDNMTWHVFSHHAMQTFADVSFTCASTDICPEDTPPSEGLSALSSLFEAQMGHRVFRFLDTLFDIIVNWIII